MPQLVLVEAPQGAGAGSGAWGRLKEGPRRTWGRRGPPYWELWPKGQDEASPAENSDLVCCLFNQPPQRLPSLECHRAFGSDSLRLGTNGV